MNEVQVFLKRLGGLGINYANKFRKDIFWRTQFIIIGTLFFLCFVDILIVVISSNKLHLQIASVVITYVTDVLANGNVQPDMNSSIMLDQIYTIRNSYLVFVGSTTVIVTLIFGYIVARIALIPTKNALASQKQFIGNIAHELRTPLAIVRANSEILLWDTKENTDTAVMTQGNLEELDKISGIINNLLTLNAFHHIEHMEFAYIDVDEIIKKSLQKYERHIQSMEIVTHIHTQKKLYVWGNQRAVEQMIGNVLKNAIAYSKKNGSITIASFKLANFFAVIQISDTGIGIEEEKLHRIFEPFYQVDSSRSGTLSESGLGLAIVSELLKLHHGAIDVKSTPEKGTTMELRLPLEPRGHFRSRAHKMKETLHTTSLNFTGLFK